MCFSHTDGVLIVRCKYSKINLYSKLQGILQIAGSVLFAKIKTIFRDGNLMQHFIEIWPATPYNAKLTIPYIFIIMYETIHQNEKG